MRTLPHQMWLDGLYMGGPICAEYGYRYHKPEYTELVIKQILLMISKTGIPGPVFCIMPGTKAEVRFGQIRRPDARQSFGEISRMGSVAILDDLDFISRDHPKYGTICQSLCSLLDAVCKVQSSEGRWYQVLDKGDTEGNWLETSCSCLFTAALCKAIRKGILDKKYFQYAKKGMRR